MRILATIRLALRALRRNKMRSVLTMLGIIIGVGSVIAAVSITTGATKQVEDKVSALGQNVITVFSGNFTSGAMRGGWGSAPTLTVADALALTQVPGVEAVSPEVRDRNQILANGLNWNTQVMGESPDYPQIRNWNMASGSMFGDADVRSVAKVAVIGKTVVDQLFPDSDPIGQTLRIRDIPFKIVGVLEAKGFNLFGQDQDDTVVIPYTSHMKRVSRRTFVNSILAQASNGAAITKVQQDITDLMLLRHRGELDFTVRTQLELAQAMTATSKVMSILLAAIASVSLIVGGIGIMNIMLASITERIREIGIRKAVGASNLNLFTQIIVESVVIAMIGGLAGLVASYGLVEILTRISSENTPVITIQAMSVAFVFSALVGVLAGLIPAFRAAKLHPIQALRYE